MWHRQDVYSDFEITLHIRVTKFDDDDQRGGYPFADEVADAVDAAICRLVQPGHGIVSVEIADEKKTLGGLCQS